MRDLSFYLPGSGPLYRWHPLTKLALLVAVTLVAYSDLLPWRGFPLLPLLLTVVLLALAAAGGGALVVRTVRLLALLLVPLAISLVLVQGFFFPGAREVLFELGPFALKAEGLRFGARILLRLLPTLTASLLFVLTTEPADFTRALVETGVPYEIAYVILAAFQLVPRMLRRADQIADAQRARGLRTDGSPVARLRGIVPLAGPLITGALQDTEERALALEARAFRAPGQRTSWRQLHDSPAQRIARWVLIIGAIALAVGARL